jgi:iron complex outermembrane recepter protein
LISSRCPLGRTSRAARALAHAANLAAASSAWAQSAPDAAPATQAQAITITGVSQRARVGLFGDKRVQDTPYSITGYSAELLADQQVRTVAQAVGNDPSVRYGGVPGSDFEQFTIRGLPLLQSEIAFDGLYGLMPTRRSGVEFAERVEVFKGPNSLLNGLSPSGAVGGVLNLVPKRAGNQPVTAVTLRAMADATFGAHIDIGRRFGEQQSRGLRVNAVARNGDTAIDKNRNRYAALNLAADWRGEGWRATADLGHHDDRLQGRKPGFSVAAGVAIPAAPAGTSNPGQDWSVFQTDATRLLLGVQVDLPAGWIASLRSGKLRHAEDYKTEPGATLIDAAGTLRHPTNGFSQVARFDTQVSDIGLLGTLRTGTVLHELAVNLNHFAAENRFASGNVGTGPVLSNLYSPASFAPPSFAGAPSAVRPGNETQLATLAIADTLNLLDRRLQLTLGAREQRIKVTNFNNTTGAVTSVIEQSKLSPAFAALYKLTPAVSLYANRTEGLARGPQAPGGSVNVAQIFPPTVARQVEAGAKADFGGWGGSLGAFEINQPFGYVDPATLVFDVRGENRIRGLELNVFGSPLPVLRLIGGITLLDGAQAGTARGSNDGKDPVAVPKVQANLFAEWREAIVPGLRLNARVLYTARQFLDPGNTQGIPAWTRLDLGLRHDFNAALTLRLNLENALGRDYWQSTTRSQLTPGASRTWLASLETRF